MLPDFSPDTLQALALQDFEALRQHLKAGQSPLAQRIAHLVERHQEALAAAPEQLLLQLQARLERDAETADWLDAAAQSPQNLKLQTKTLIGAWQPEQWHNKHHQRLVHALDILPDCDTVVSAGEDSRLLRWSLSRPLDPPIELKGHQGPVNHLVVSADGRWMATAGDDGKVGIWEIPSLTLVKMIDAHNNYVRQVAITGDRLISVSQDRMAKVWSLPGGLPLYKLTHNQDVMSVGISDDGRYAATSTINSAMFLWDLNTGKKVCQIYGNKEKVHKIMGDMYLSGTNYSEVGHKEYPQVIRFDEAGQLWSFGTELIVWDTANKKKPAEHIRQPKVMRFSATAATWVRRDILAIGGDGIKLLKLRKGGQWLPSDAQEEGGGFGVSLSRCTALTLSPDAKTLLSGHDDGSVYAWDLKGDLATLPRTYHAGAIWYMHQSPSKRYLASRANGDSVCIWDTQTGACVDQYNLHDPNSYGQWCDFSPDESWLAIGDGKATIQLRPLQKGGEPKSLRFPCDKDYQAISSLAFSQDGQFIYAGVGSGGLYKVDIQNPAQSKKFEGYSYSPSHIFPVSPQLIISLDNFPVSETEDWQQNVYQLLGWDPIHAKRIYRVSSEKGKSSTDYISFGEVSLVPEGLISMSGTADRGLVLRDPGTGEITRHFQTTVRYNTGFRRLNDGRWGMMLQVVDKEQSRPTIFDPKTETVLQHLDEGWVSRDISPDGRLVARSKGKNIEIYDLATTQIVGRFFGDYDMAQAYFVSETRLFAADQGGYMHILDILDFYI